MSKFSYRARNYNGESVNGEVDAVGISEAKKMISQQLKLIPIEVSPFRQKLDTSSSWQTTFDSYFVKVKSEEKMQFFQQLQTIISVGVPLLQGLTMMAAQIKNPLLEKIVKSLMSDISEGLAMSEAMGKFNKVFDPITINLIKIGESTGQLDVILEQISLILQTQVEQKAKIK